MNIASAVTGETGGRLYGGLDIHQGLKIDEGHNENRAANKPWAGKWLKCQLGQLTTNKPGNRFFNLAGHLLDEGYQPTKSCYTNKSSGIRVFIRVDKFVYSIVRTSIKKEKYRG